MADVWIISIDELVNSSPISLDVDSKFLSMSISDAHTIDLQTILGTVLYDKMMYLISGGTITSAANVNYKYLLDRYIYPAMLKYSLYRSLPYIRWKIMNKGVTQQESESSKPTSIDEFDRLYNIIKNDAEFLGQRITTQILQYMQYYPEYTQSVHINELKPTLTPYKTGIYMDSPEYYLRRYSGYNDGQVTFHGNQPD